MKKINVLIGCMFAFMFSQAQQLTGSWSGNMDLHGKEISVVFHVTHQNQKLIATMDSPSQKVYGFSTSSTELKDSVLTIYMNEANMQYQGRIMKDGTMKGIFTQMGKMYSLNLIHEGRSHISETINNDKSRIKSYAYSYHIDTVSINDKFNVLYTEPLKSGKTAAIIIDCKDFNKNDLSKNSNLNNIIDQLTSKGITVICPLKSSFDKNATIAYLKTCNKVNQKKISVLTITQNEMVASIGNNSKTIKINNSNNQNNEINQIANWLLQIS